MIISQLKKYIDANVNNFFQSGRKGNVKILSRKSVMNILNDQSKKNRKLCVIEAGFKKE